MMTSTAKTWLKKTVRSLRERLLKDIRDGVDSRYKLAIKRGDAVLDEAQRMKRTRLEDWLNSQVRTAARALKESDEQVRERFLSEAIKLRAATLLNRLVVIRQMETLGLSQTKILTGGWDSSGYKSFREFAPEARGHESEGFPVLCQMLFDELSAQQPELFAPSPLEPLFPVSAAMWRDLVDTLDSKELSAEERAGLWEDDTLLGWVYQFWNDPDLDELRARKGKIENHELAAKTQLFTDRYIVEWILQNALGQLWLEICERNGWEPEVLRNGTLDSLERRRIEFRALREAGEISLEALMPTDSLLEENWSYWVPRQVPKAERESGPTSLRDVKILDPACGSGHFLLKAFELLAALYEEESRHRQESWSVEQIAVWILEGNLHGLDIDSRAVQVANAALWLKVKRYAPVVVTASSNLVATDFGLRGLTQDEPEVSQFLQDLGDETGLPDALLSELLAGLKDAEHLGSLLRLSKLLTAAETALVGTLWDGGDVQQLLANRFADFVDRHVLDSGMTVRLHGPGLLKCVDFLRLNQEDTYDLVVGNPPYLQASDAPDLPLEKLYPDGKTDLYAAFLLRGLELAKPGGYSALITMRGWMFLTTFRKLRRWLLDTSSLYLIGDLNHGCFDTIPGVHVATVMTLFSKRTPDSEKTVAMMPTPLDDYQQDNRRTFRKMAALRAAVGRYEFHPDQLVVIPEQPLVYWWTQHFLDLYDRTPLLKDEAPARKGICTGDDERYHRSWHEVEVGSVVTQRVSTTPITKSANWMPGLKGAQGRVWLEPLVDVIRWRSSGLELRVFEYTSKGVRFQNAEYYLVAGVAFSMIGSSFTARAHRFRSIFGNKGSSVFPMDVPNTLCLMNSTKAKFVLNSLNPGIGYEVGDVNRLPLFPIESADQIVVQLDLAFSQHEQARETSVEFLQPGPSAWGYAQQWAQAAVDRPAGAQLPPYEPVLVEPAAGDHFSHALGLALGRFLPFDQVPTEPRYEGAPISAVATDQSLPHALPHGILFLSQEGDSLDHPACERLCQTWHKRPLAKGTLREYLKTKFFTDDHLKRYDKRPIYFPLSSARKTFVAYLSIHRWTASTLEHLLADHIQPEIHRLSGEFNDLAGARHQGDTKSQGLAQARYDQVSELLLELQSFADQVRQIAEKGAPPSDPKCPSREVDAPFEMDLDDGVMINSAALWPLLEPQWKDPRRWWKELSEAKGKKDYDWAHLAKRYWPQRVDAKCQTDPSLAVAHQCFWKYHAAKAYEWELRLQAPDELGPDFKLDEPGSDNYRSQFESAHRDKCGELRENEEKRRVKKAAKGGQSQPAAREQVEEQLELEV